jgi:hypothetical protein
MESESAAAICRRPEAGSRVGVLTHLDTGRASNRWRRAARELAPLLKTRGCRRGHDEKRATHRGNRDVAGSGGRARGQRGAPDAPAAEVLGRAAAPWAVAGQMSFFVDGQPAYASIGIDVERVLTPVPAHRRRRVDAACPRPSPRRWESSTSSRRWTSAHPRPRCVAARLGRSPRAVPGPRAALLDGRRLRRSLAGAREAGYAFRAAGGFTFLYAIGAELVVTERSRAHPRQHVRHRLMPGHAARGDATTVVRGANRLLVLIRVTGRRPGRTPSATRTSGPRGRP